MDTKSHSFLNKEKMIFSQLKQVFFGKEKNFWEFGVSVKKAYIEFDSFSLEEKV